MMEMLSVWIGIIGFALLCALFLLIGWNGMAELNQFVGPTWGEVRGVFEIASVGGFVLGFLVMIGMGPP